MRAYHFRKVILQDEELLVIVPRALCPEIISGSRIRPHTAPESRISDLRSLKFDAEPEERRRILIDRVIEAGISASAVDLNAIRSIRKLEVVHSCTAQQLGQLDG